MATTYILARDHLEQAASILKGEDDQTAQLRLIVERMIELMYEIELKDRQGSPNIIDLQSVRFARTREAARLAD
jgi:hypothetical protein